MKRKTIVHIIMLVVLAVRIALTAYGVTGRNIYSDAAAMMGTDLKSAMSYIREPSKLEEINLSKIGAAKAKAFLKGLGLDAGKVDAAIDERIAYENALANAKDREKFLAYAQSVDETVTADNLNDLLKDRERAESMRPAAWIRGPSRKPKSREVRSTARRCARSRSSLSPMGAAANAFSAFAARIRFCPSSGTISTTVASPARTISGAPNFPPP